jgi:hypothetical protein
LSATVFTTPESVENREQQQRVFGRLAERFGLFDQQTRLLHGCFGFRRSISFDVTERGDERYLKIDLRAAPRGRAGQGRDLIKRAIDLFKGFHQRRALQRPLSRFAPQAHRFLDLPGFSAVTRQQLGLAFGNVGELTFEDFAARLDRCLARSASARLMEAKTLPQPE